MVIEAAQITEAMVREEEPLLEGAVVVSKRWNPVSLAIYSYRIVVQTPGGRMEARIGDWVIIGFKSASRVVRADIFEATYDPV